MGHVVNCPSGYNKGMVIGALEVQLRLHSCHSLKEKRSVVKGMIERIRRRFSVSCAEVGDLNTWQSATIGLATVSNDSRVAESVLTSVLEFIDSIVEAEATTIARETITV